MRKTARPVVWEGAGAQSPALDPIGSQDGYRYDGDSARRAGAILLSASGFALTLSQMLKALLLIFDPATTWEKIATNRQNVAVVFILVVVPLLLVSAAAEGAALIKFGREQGPLDQVMPFAQDLVIRYEVAQTVLSLLVVFGGAWLLQRIGAGFHRPHTYSECFVTLAYALGPLFLLRIPAGLPAVNSWICWAVGILLSVAALYRGIPRIMKPDPTNALGLYLLFSFVLIVVAGLAHFVAGLVLTERLLTHGWGLERFL